MYAKTFAAAALIAGVSAQYSNGTVATVTSLLEETITSCPPEVTDCPLRSTSAPAAATTSESPKVEAVVTVESTSVETIVSCASDVTDCPARSKAAATSSAPSSAPAAPVAPENSTAPVAPAPAPVTSVAPVVTEPPAFNGPAAASGSETTYVTVVEGKTITVVGYKTGVNTATGFEIANGAAPAVVGGGVLAVIAGMLL